MKAVIGVPSDQLVENQPKIPGNYPVYAPHDIKEAVFAAGGLPLILPFPDKREVAAETAKELSTLLDGLLLAGGPDVDPLFFDEEPLPALGMTLAAKDWFEGALIKEMLAAHKPILGICRGIQILNATLGGTLYQDLKTQYSGYAVQHRQAALGHLPTHHVSVVPQSYLGKLLGTKLVVNSRHHQAIRTLAPGLSATAFATDGVIEALESKGQEVLAVQWHPENLWQNDPVEFRLFTDFVKRAQKD
ncbi:gamma-glutamyl-gamma-aminobutyrate hydrolase family protein [Liquorilactobacillus satsumensis]|uniref:Glutamine amidotransferase n=1 Tax=Liquorilactobacillus satsumensis DSM 16230 = JCM 12392 TaxID=1423801 RepID=A0A0R1UX12_9LACO|nr:gamma-glutamyl-gamma-aminobutyrate hydrolase family protein [Liquorilactobacillus satsumensis]KRL97703.1 glutamine amidotransferase [Liquorilactobacillus satsumensis DSM 16230 = JCM 12392]MCC7666532.1 gamma-glutamyl-gamma-aminobutyrate hydrolase [Liquorilactobacillus satsumensis]MCP9329670.1 gamma-glutamyl-gamma-aminobutyrate hydrolase family protein [Liquorilactobacillus satsumensis]MCP9357502.1 gamma-glutamyl-gamma-aminobutyrate hydrolase family protein [Liquorilactobacillus satsumensis]M